MDGKGFGTRKLMPHRRTDHLHDCCCRIRSDRISEDVRRPLRNGSCTIDNPEVKRQTSTDANSEQGRIFMEVPRLVKRGFGLSHHTGLMCLFLSPALAICQVTFVAIPDTSSHLYHLDFARTFFATGQEQKVARALYDNTLRELQSYEGTVAASSGNLLNALQLYDSVLVQFIRHDSYLYLRQAIDTRDVLSRDENSRMEAEFSERTAFLQQELMQLDSALFGRFRRERPALDRYSFYVASARRYKPHTLSLTEEETLSATATLTDGWQYELYQTLLSRGSYGEIVTSTATLDARRDRRVIAADTSRSVREAGFRSLYGGYASQRDLYAFTLIRLAAARNRRAQLHHFEDAPSEVYFDSYWTKADVETLLTRIGRSGEVRKRYERLRADFVKKQFGYSDVNVWDMSVPYPGEGTPRFTIEQAREIIVEALSPLGSEYGQELGLLLDPTNGRMDIVPGNNRKAGGFSVGFPGVTTVFFTGGFEGYYNDVRVMTHELGHAVHRELMKNGQVSPVYADGPHFLFESFSIFNEFLLVDYLRRHARDDAGKRYFLEKYFDGKGLEMFGVGQEESLELAIYDGVRRGAVHTADDLDSLARETSSSFSLWPPKHDELKMSWITSSLFYEDPLYDANYVFGAILALKYYALYEREPNTFVPRYIALLKNGFDAPPAELLNKHLGIDLGDPSLVTDAVRQVDERLRLLEKEYSK
jgi:oligoendopeptidase F